MAGEGTGAPAGAFSQEQLDTIQATVSSIVNSAITSRDKMSDKKRGEDRDAFKKMLDESLAGLKPASTESSEGKEGKGGKEPKENVELATMRRKLEELQTRSDAFETRANEERAKSRRIALDQAVTAALSGHGVDGVGARAAIALLKADGRIAFQDEDSDDIVYRGDDGVAVDLGIGLRSWAKTPEAKIFLPGNQARGSGSRPGGSSPFAGNGGKPTREQQGAIINDLLDRNL